MLRYETALKADKLVIALNGDTEEIEHARQLLATSGMASFDHHQQHDESELAI